MGESPTSKYNSSESLLTAIKLHLVFFYLFAVEISIVCLFFQWCSACSTERVMLLLFCVLSAPFVVLFRAFFFVVVVGVVAVLSK